MTTQLRALEAEDEQPDRSSYGTEDVSSPAREHLMRRGMLWGASAGFLFGLMPLVASTVVGAMAGAIIAKLSHVKFDKGSAPRVYFR